MPANFSANFTKNSQFSFNFSVILESQSKFIKKISRNNNSKLIVTDSAKQTGSQNLAIKLKILRFVFCKNTFKTFN